MKNFYDKWYQASNMHLVVVSGVKSSIVRPKIDTVFTSIRDEKVQRPELLDKIDFSGLKINVESKEVNEVYFAFSFKSKKCK